MGYICLTFLVQGILVCKKFCTKLFKGTKHQYIHINWNIAYTRQQAFESFCQWAGQAFARFVIISSCCWTTFETYMFAKSFFTVQQPLIMCSVIFSFWSYRVKLWWRCKPWKWANILYFILHASVRQVSEDFTSPISMPRCRRFVLSSIMCTISVAFDRQVNHEKLEHPAIIPTSKVQKKTDLTRGSLYCCSQVDGISKDSIRSLVNKCSPKVTFDVFPQLSGHQIFTSWHGHYEKAGVPKSIAYIINES